MILKKEHRDNRYVPLISHALASLCNRSSRVEMKQTIMSWSDSTTIPHTMETLADNLDHRIRQILSQKEDEMKSAINCEKDSKVKVEDLCDDESSSLGSTASKTSLSHLIDDQMDLSRSQDLNEKDIDEVKESNTFVGDGLFITSNDLQAYDEW
jgi:enolase